MRKMRKVTFKNFDFIIVPFLIVFGFGFLFYYCPFPFVPDFFDLRSYEKTYELFNLIISSLVSLIGIYITVSLVAYEFFKQRSGVDFHKSLLVNRLNAHFISFSVFTILFSFTSSIIISSDNPNDSEISVIYFNAFLFIGVMIFLFPVAFNLFSSLRPEKIANQELLKINSQSIFITAMDPSSIDEETESIENDALLKVESIVIALIAVKDVFKARAIIQKTSIRIANLIIDEENSEDKKYITERLVAFHIRIIDFSLSQPNNSTILKSIWYTTNDMYTVLIDRQETAQHFETFHNQFFERYFKRLIRVNNEEIIFEGIKVVKLIVQRQMLKNMAKDTEITTLYSLRSSIESNFEYPESYSREEVRNSIHFQAVAVDLMSCFTFLMNSGVKLNLPDILNKCFQELNDLNFRLELKGVGIYAQCYFMIGAANKICDYTYQAFEKNVFLEGHEAESTLPVLFEDYCEKKHPAARTILQKYCYMLLKLQKINKLDRWFLGGLTIGNVFTFEGELGKVSWRCANKYKDGKEIQDCLEDCINAYEILKEYYEDHPPQDFGLYLGIKLRLESVLKGLKRNKVYNRKIYKTVKLLIFSFKEKKEMQS